MTSPSSLCFALDADRFEESGIPKTVKSIGDDLGIERVARLETEVVGHRIEGDGHSTFDDDLGDVDLIVLAAGGRARAR